ncbi:class A beta-lactamase [Pseudomonas sp. dw_358]|uniref:class A beta-lactamase n=1 Tax=Pseudomonas sp. dw_358 TaxID=2720083 RepID=UPI001BD20F1A|nr:class A beta-lactamase [Pseudomonas sp. dw_358]
MPAVLHRRRFLLAAVAAPLFLSPRLSLATSTHPRVAFAALEHQLQGRLGVFALDTASGATLGYREHERFAFCSTFKAALGGAILQQSIDDKDLLGRRVPYAAADMVNYSPITQHHVGAGMTWAELCAAAIQYSDNSASNLLLRQVGGPQGLTRFARAQGDSTFRLDRIETGLNSAIPGDLRDTSTPAAMARLLQRLTLGDGLPSMQRAQLLQWLVGNTTGNRRIRAGVPTGWQVGDKTGTGDYAAAGDIAVVMPPGQAPWVVAIYTTQPEREAKAREEVIAQAMEVVVQAWHS